MRNLVLILSVALIMASCTGPKYVTQTHFYTLEKGITEKQFVSHLGGYVPTSTKMFSHGGYDWKVYVFAVHNVGYISATIDHYEYVAFKNGLMEEYGTGTLPIALRQNPNSYDVTIH